MNIIALLKRWAAIFRRRIGYPKLWIRRCQLRVMRADPPGSRAVVVFLVPGVDGVNGGIMAIHRHADETRRLLDRRGYAVYVATYPGGRSITRCTRFENSNKVVAFDLLLEFVSPQERLHINIPEEFIGGFLDHGVPLLGGRIAGMTSYNIMVQNIEMAPERSLVGRLQQHGFVTASTAHAAYSLRCSALLGCPSWHWSVWVSPEVYEYRNPGSKEDIIVVSPDAHPERERVLALVQAALPAFRVVRVWKMTHGQYKDLIGRARYTLTFGEGLDGYFVETIFSGSVGLAVYNDRFFTSDYRGLPGVFSSWADLGEQMPALIQGMTPGKYNEIRQAQYCVVKRNYDYAEYVNNLRRYYSAVLPGGLVG